MLRFKASVNSRRVLTLMALVVFLGHFSLTVIYCLPRWWVPEPIAKVANGYIIPVFHQRWVLFAPDPPMQYGELYYRCHFSDGTQSPWVDPERTWLETHHKTRLLHYQKMAELSFFTGKNLADLHYRYREKLGKDATEGQVFWEQVQGSEVMNLARRWITQHAAGEFPANAIDSLEIGWATRHCVAPTNYPVKADSSVTEPPFNFRFKTAPWP